MDPAPIVMSEPTAAELRLAPLRIDPQIYDLEDAAGTVGGAPWRWRWTVEGLDSLPGAALVALEAMADTLIAAGGTGSDLPSLAASVETELRRLAAEHGARRPLAEVLGPNHPLLTATQTVDVMLSAAGRSVATAVGHAATGRLAHLHVGGGGAPKHPVTAAAVGPRGLAGDRQGVRRHHGRPFQAVSLWSLEVIEALRAEGHPVAPGCAGENLTLAGVDFAQLRPGTRLALGRGAEIVCLEITSWAIPCSTIAGCFLGGDFTRIDHDRHHGWARAYAAVLRPGTVHAGDPVDVLP